MVNPALTLMFDVFLIGSAGLIVAAMVDEYRASREPAAGRARRPLPRCSRRTPVVHDDVHHLMTQRPRRFRLSVG